MTKKKVLIHSDFPLAKTGFGKNCRNIMEYLYKTNKYEKFTDNLFLFNAHFDDNHG